jgi:hypothetical protein
MDFAAASALLTSVASTVETGRYCTLASWVLLLYDHIIHLDKEIELFWMKKWSVAKGLYLFVRVDIHLKPHCSVTLLYKLLHCS